MTLIEILAWEAKERIKLADENRKNGVSDPLNDMTDSLQAILARGESIITTRPRRSKQAANRKKRKDE